MVVTLKTMEKTFTPTWYLLTCSFHRDFLSQLAMSTFIILRVRVTQWVLLALRPQKTWPEPARLSKGGLGVL